jgi:pSer/pThr/pTyr-binding forkhead associated (FHA) protein
MMGGGPSVIGVGDGSGSPTSKKELDQLERKNITTISKSLNEHMYLVVRSLKHENNKIEYVMQRGDIIKLGRIKFAVKEINIVEEIMEVDEGD